MSLLSEFFCFNEKIKEALFVVWYYLTNLNLKMKTYKINFTQAWEFENLISAGLPYWLVYKPNIFDKIFGWKTGGRLIHATNFYIHLNLVELRSENIKIWLENDTLRVQWTYSERREFFLWVLTCWSEPLSCAATVFVLIGRRFWKFALKALWEHMFIILLKL